MNNYNKEKIYYTKLLNECLQPMSNFDCLEYKVHGNTGGEFIRLYDAIGNVYYLNITGLDLEHIIIDVIATVIGNEPKSRITDRKKCIALSKLFKEG